MREYGEQRRSGISQRHVDRSREETQHQLLPVRAAPRPGVSPLPCVRARARAPTGILSSTSSRATLPSRTKHQQRPSSLSTTSTRWWCAAERHDDGGAFPRRRTILVAARPRLIMYAKTVSRRRRARRLLWARGGLEYVRQHTVSSPTRTVRTYMWVNSFFEPRFVP